ncbi:MAG: SDR family NAD(P)-dependent oxidoreductase [Phycisphaerales bacterium]
MAGPHSCIVVGAAGGIGSRLCRRLKSDGWNLVLVGRSEDSLSPLADELNATMHAFDAADADRMLELAEQTEGLRGVVNLAGSILLKPAHSTTMAEFDQTLHQNLRTAFSCVRAAGRAMRDAGGSVVLMSSCAGSFGLSNHEAISAAKAGVEGLVRSAAASYAAQGIRFNAVAPGLTDTPLSSRITGSEPSLKASIAMHPLGRIGSPDEIARVIAFLMHDESGWITGQVLGVDGGLARVRSR